MVKRFGDESVLYGWLRNRNTIEFLGIWEQIYNPAFKPIEFERFKSQAGLSSFSLSPKKWIDATDAIGLYAKAGRGGGTYVGNNSHFWQAETRCVMDWVDFSVICRNFTVFISGLCGYVRQRDTQSFL